MPIRNRSASHPSYSRLPKISPPSVAYLDCCTLHGTRQEILEIERRVPRAFSVMEGACASARSGYGMQRRPILVGSRWEDGISCKSPGVKVHSTSPNHSTITSVRRTDIQSSGVSRDGWIILLQGGRGIVSRNSQIFLFLAIDVSVVGI